MSAPGDDAQRDLEQRALRNVRALVDKIENKDELDRKSLRKHLIVVVVGVIVFFAVLFALLKIFSRQEPARTLVIPPPAKTAPK